MKEAYVAKNSTPEKNAIPDKNAISAKNATPARNAIPIRNATPDRNSVERKSFPDRSSPLRTESTDNNGSPDRNLPVTSLNPPPKMLEFINKLLKNLSNKMKGGDTLNSDSMFAIKGTSDEDKKFVSHAWKLKFPSFKQLLIGFLDKYETKDEIVNMNYFMANAISNPVKFLILSGGDFGNISRFKSGISRIFKMITHEIYLMQFEIDDISLKTIIGKLKITLINSSFYRGKRWSFKTGISKLQDFNSKRIYSW